LHRRHHRAIATGIVVAPYLGGTGITDYIKTPALPRLGITT